MTVAIADAAAVSTTSASTLTVSLAGAAERGDILWVAVVAAIGTLPSITYRTNLGVMGSPFMSQPDGCAGVEMVQSIWNATGGEQNFTVSTDTPSTPWGVLIARITGDAHLPPYDVEFLVGDGPDVVETGSFYVPDTGVALGVATTSESVGFSPPTDWTSLILFDLGSLTVAAAWEPVVLSVEPTQEWGGTPSTGTEWLTTVMTFQDIAMRLPPASAFGSNPGGMLMVPGPVEPPPVVDPFIPEINPLPPLPTEIETPLDPWVPKPGPYRGDT